MSQYFVSKIENDSTLSGDKDKIPSSKTLSIYRFSLPPNYTFQFKNNRYNISIPPHLIIPNEFQIARILFTRKDWSCQISFGIMDAALTPKSECFNISTEATTADLRTVVIDPATKNSWGVFRVKPMSGTLPFAVGFYYAFEQLPIPVNTFLCITTAVDDITYIGDFSPFT